MRLSSYTATDTQRQTERLNSSSFDLLDAVVNVRRGADWAATGERRDPQRGVLQATLRIRYTGPLFLFVLEPNRMTYHAWSDES